MSKSLAYGDFGSWCSEIPSLAVCNLFFRRLLKDQRVEVLGFPANASKDGEQEHVYHELIGMAGVGINPKCAIPRYGHKGSKGNVALIVACSMMMALGALLVTRVHKRVAAVGRQEVKVLVVTYWLTLPLQILASGSLLEQGSLAISIITAILEALQLSVFWSLLACGIISTQVVEDGTMASLLPIWTFWILCFTTGMVISLDTSINFAHIFGYHSDSPGDLSNPALFSVVFVVPIAASVIYALLNIYVSLVALREWKPLAWTALAGTLWSSSHVINILTSRKLCQVTHQTLDTSFIAALLQFTSLWAFVQGWEVSTEESWEDDIFTDPERQKLDFNDSFRD
ncbi:hypothetical protein IE53DRAFT_2638 [Violaceomyces palustris]|uniref:Uncharacterized protein n=1 Tax=Violaceomyces palustris TaxID=1673888 RepID=A0ACD0P7X3_9BASI|nr:hypothetical protein IE53DRAFT_2638 [Violaceomyces palustris]